LYFQSEFSENQFMDSNDYITWSGDNVIFTIPEFQLPFSIAYLGLLFSVVIFYFGWKKLKADAPKGSSPAEWKGWALAIAAFFIGQLPFFVIDAPSLESIGPIQPVWYGLLFATAFIVGYMVTSKMFKHGGRTQEEMDRLLIYLLIATVVGARLGHVIFYDPEFYLRNIHLIPQVWLGGLASHGAAITIIIAMYMFAKKIPEMSFFWVADRVVPSVALAGVFIRIGNFTNSEILGRETDLPWAVIFEVAPALTAAERMVPRHPSMLYESLFSVVVFLVLWWIYKKYKHRPPEGSLFATFLVMLFTGRFLIEFTKLHQAAFEEGWTLTMGQWLSIPLVAYGIWVLAKKVDWSKQGKWIGKKEK